MNKQISLLVLKHSEKPYYTDTWAGLGRRVILHNILTKPKSALLIKIVSKTEFKTDKSALGSVQMKHFCQEVVEVDQYFTRV